MTKQQAYEALLRSGCNLAGSRKGRVINAACRCAATGCTIVLPCSEVEMMHALRYLRECQACGSLY